MSSLVAVLYAALAAQTQTIPVPELVTNERAFAARVDERLSVMSRFGFSGVVLIALEGRPVLARAYGMADREKRVPNQVSTMFSVGSLSKQFTAAAILKLEMRGKLSTSDPISKFLPRVPADKRSITIHQLLTHTSGLPEDDGGGAFMRRDVAVGNFLSEKLVAPAGEKMRYSNHGYTLLAAIVERVSGKPFDEFLRQELFLPSGMRATGYRPANLDPRRVAHYYVEENAHGSPLDWLYPNWALMGSGGILSTATDLHRWYLALQDESVLSNAEKRKMFTDYGHNYGYGWGVHQSPLGMMLGHDGGNTLGVGADMRWFPGNHVLLISFANDAGETKLLGRAGIRSQLLALTAGKPLPVIPGAISDGTSGFDKFAGRYANTNGEVLDVSVVGGAVRLGAAGPHVFAAVAPSAPATAANLDAARERAIAIARAAVRRDTAEVHRLAGLEVRPARITNAIAAMQQSLGTLKDVAVLGASSSSDDPPSIFLRFAMVRGEKDMVMVIAGGEMTQWGVLSQPVAWTYVPVSANEVAAYDWTTGQLRRARFQRRGAFTEAVLLRGDEEVLTLVRK